MLLWIKLDVRPAGNYCYLIVTWMEWDSFSFYTLICVF